MRRTLAAAACLLGAALALSACGEIKTQINPVASQAQPLTLALDSPANATQAGIFAARSDGAMTRAGIDLQLRTTTSTEQALAEVESGKVDVAIASEPEVMIARNRHAAVLGFGAITQGPQATIVSLKRRKHRTIRSVKDLQGTRLGVDGLASESALLSTMLQRAGVASQRVGRVTVRANPVAALLSGRVNAYYGNQAASVAAALRARHKGVEVVPDDKLGLLPYDGLVFVTRAVYFAPHTNLLRRFVQAVGRGYQAVRDDPSAGVQALKAARPTLDATLAGTQLTSTMRELFPAEGRPWGWQSSTAWNAFGRFLTSQQVISAPGAWEQASTNQLLAGQGP